MAHSRSSSMARYITSSTCGAKLQGRGAQFATVSDTEVLLLGWRYWREGLLARLSGMFAFALWDAKEQTLVLARDRFGKKPLHYAALADGTLAFGSEIKSLLRVPGIGRTLDHEAVEDFFTYGYVPDPKSIYRSIRKLPGGHMLVAAVVGDRWSSKTNMWSAVGEAGRAVAKQPTKPLSRGSAMR